MTSRINRMKEMKSFSFKMIIILAVLSSVCSAGLVAHWAFDEGSGSTAGDSSGNDYTGMLNGSPAWVAGKVGGALRFDGSNDYVSTSQSLLNNLSEFTLACWVNADVYTNKVGFVGQNDCTEFGFNGSDLRCWNTSVNGRVTGTWTHGTGSWHHVAVTGDSSGMNLYIDGKFFAGPSAAPGGNFGSSSDPVRIGGGGIWGPSGDYFDGIIDEVYIYDHALSQTEIEALYNGTEPRVINQVPVNGSGHIDPNGMMSWGVANATTPTFEISIGTDANCDDVLLDHNTVSDMNYTPAPGLLDVAAKYYWRVDVHQDGNEYVGNVLSFTTAGKVSDPTPGDDETDVSPVGNVSWTGDSLTASYDVYFAEMGQSLTFVGNYVDANVSKVALAQAIGIGILQSNTEYEWRVDTRDSGDTLLATGYLWSFTVEEYYGSYVVLVEDFFDYADTTELLAVWSESSSANIEALPLINIMQFDYNNASSPYKSETTMTLSPVQNWSDFTTSLDFKLLGSEENASELVYVILGDGTTTYKVVIPKASIDSNDNWQVLSVQLSEFEDNSVDLTKIETITIGIGDGVSTGGAGTVFINDIEIHPMRCLGEYADAADVTGDCEVDIADLAVVTGDWLYADFNVTASSPSSGLVAHYDFNEISGYTANDSSGNNYDAAIEPGTVSGFRDSSGLSGYCISFSDPNLEVNIPASVFNTVSNELTVSMWLYGEVNSVPDPIRTVEIFAGTAPAEDPNYHWDRLVWNLTSKDQYEGQWNHYAMVKDADVNTIEVYVNGILVARKSDAPAVMTGASAGVTILTMTPGQELTTVKVDELKIFDAALSQQEIVYLAKGSGGYAIQPIAPVLTDADIVDDGTINLKDIARIALEWLTDQGW